MRASSCLSSIRRCSRYCEVIPVTVVKGVVTYEISGCGGGVGIGVSRMIIGGVAFGVITVVVPWRSQVFEKSEVIEQYIFCVNL